MLKNKKGDMTPFDMTRKPCRQSAILLPLIWGISYLATRRFHLKISKKNMDGIKPPFLVLSTHQGFSDYYIAPLALFPYRANYVSDMEGFAAFGNELYRKCGCIGKRRYVSDIFVMKHIFHVLQKNHDILVLFPESRHSNVGTTAKIPDNMGKLVKKLNVPLVMLSVHGSYLANPFWDEEHTRKVPMEATLECVYTAEQIAHHSEQEIQNVIEQHLSYNEYEWMKEKGYHIFGKKSAEGLEKVLYQCKACMAENKIITHGNVLECKKCGNSWNIEDIDIPAWYEWQREQTIREIENDAYGIDMKVTVEALPNEKGFVPLGEGRLRQRADGFLLQMKDQELFFSHKNMESLQTEYNYRGKGKCIVLSTRNCCYYIYPGNDQTSISFQPTKMQFATEFYHEQMKNRRRTNDKRTKNR